MRVLGGVGGVGGGAKRGEQVNPLVVAAYDYILLHVFAIAEQPVQVDCLAGEREDAFSIFFLASGGGWGGLGRLGGGPVPSVSGFR